MTYVVVGPVWPATLKPQPQVALGNGCAHRFALDKRSLDRQARLK